MVVEETRTGVCGTNSVRWLVSCKHMAHSGKSVSKKDEINIVERMRIKKCNAFMGFYSTIISSGLGNILPRDNEVKIYDRSSIEHELLKKLAQNNSVVNLIKSYFPNSYENSIRPRLKSNIPLASSDVVCDMTGVKLLKDGGYGNILFFSNNNNPKEYKVSFVCKEKDNELEQKMLNKGWTMEGWEEIADLKNPMIFIEYCIRFLQMQHSGISFSEESFPKIQNLLCQAFKYVARDMTEEEKEHFNDLVSSLTQQGMFWNFSE